MALNEDPPTSDFSAFFVYNNMKTPKANYTELVGQIELFPIEIVNKMLYYQYKQGNKVDISVFQFRKYSNFKDGGFDWALTSEGYNVWYSVIHRLDFDLI